MKKKNLIEIILIFILFLTSLYVWTLPIRTNNMPFGDVDSSTHFISADYMAQTNKAFIKTPFYIQKSLGQDAGGQLVYPPQYYTAEGIAQILGGERIIPIFIFIAIASFSMVFSVYFLIRNLFGLIPAFLASSLLIFSGRDILVYIWGLWPERFAYAFVPLILYAYYKYTENTLNKKYLYLFLITLLIQFTMHPRIPFYTITIIGLYSLVLIIKSKKLPFEIKDIIKISVLFLILFLLLLPFQVDIILNYTGLRKAETSASLIAEEGIGLRTEKLDRLFSWYKTSKQEKVSNSYFSYSAMNSSWTLPLLFLGIIFLLLKRKKENLLLLSWLIGLYIFLHLDVIGVGSAHRSLSAEAHLFYPITALGLASIPLLIKIDKKQKQALYSVLIVAFLLLAFFYNTSPQYDLLKNIYQGINRITPYEYETTKWMRENTPENSTFMLVGTIPVAKKKWFRGLAMRNLAYGNTIFSYDAPYFLDITDHVVIDYSDAVLVNNENLLNQLAAWEKIKFIDGKAGNLIYNDNYARIYKLSISAGELLKENV